MQAKWVTCISEQKDFFCFQSTMFPAMSSFQIPHLPFNKESWEQSNHSDCSIRYFLRTVIKSSIFYVLLAETCIKYCDLTFTPWPNALAAEINVLLLMHTDKFSTAEHTWISIPPEKKKSKKNSYRKAQLLQSLQELVKILTRSTCLFCRSSSHFKWMFNVKMFKLQLLYPEASLQDCTYTVLAVMTPYFFLTPILYDCYFLTVHFKIHIS